MNYSDFIKIVKENKVNQEAYKLYKERLESDYPEFDIIKYAISLGLKVFGKNTWGDEISGEFRQENKEIYYNANHSRNRIKFTLAHEIGHYLLGHSDKEEYFRSLDIEYTPQELKEEREADNFAGQLLVPDEYIEKMIEKGYSILQMAKEVRISETAFLIRYSNYKANNK